METSVDRTDSTTPSETGSDELDLRDIAKSMWHPLIFTRFEELAVGESFVLVTDHDPKHLRQELDRDHRGAIDWAYLETGGPQLLRIRITRRTATDVPQVLGNTGDLVVGDGPDPGAPATLGGAVWKLESSQRQLDANVIHLVPSGLIHPHVGPDQDVLLHVLGGSGHVDSDAGVADLAVGSLVWLPRRSRRSIVAGADGLSYLSVHARRPGMSIGLTGP